MEDDILDDFEKNKSKANANITLYITSISVIYVIAVSIFPDFLQSLPKLLVGLIFLIVIIAPFIALYYSYQSYARGEDAVLQRVIAVIINGILAAAWIYAVYSGALSQFLKWFFNLD